MKIGVVGTGYVGLVQAVVLSEFGDDVICMDIDESKISTLNNGGITIYEPGLLELKNRNFDRGRLTFTTDIAETVKQAEVIFIAVGTPPMDDGSADLKYVLEVAKNIATHMDKYTVIVTKSTVPVGTGKLIKETIKSIMLKNNKEIEFDVVSNPEFLREGKAIRDCFTPDRIVIGTESEKAKKIMANVYNVFTINQTPFVFTNIETAELIKYSANSFLAVKISFINEMALLCEQVGANIQDISRAMGMDGRISPKFLHAGPGYGGSCFPKDSKALVNTGNRNGVEMNVVSAAIKANETQKKAAVIKVINTLGDVKNKTITILGLSFKPDTDDMRDAPSITIISELISNGAKIKAYCPQGIKEAKWRLEEYNSDIKYCEDEYEAAIDSDAVVVITEWNEFRGVDLLKMSSKMKNKYLFDFRNIYVKSNEARDIFLYYPLGSD